MSSALANTTPQRSLWKRFSANFLSYGYSQVVTLAVQFLTVPFFLSYWGKTGYAEWLVLSGLPIMLGLLDLGVAHASASKATMLAARNDIDGVRCSLQTSLAFTLVVTTLILGTGAVIAQTVDWAAVLKLNTINNRDAGLVLVLLLGHLTVNMLGGPLNAWFIAMDRASTGFFLLANRRLLDVFVTITALAVGGSAVELSLALLVGQTLLLLAVTSYAVHTSPWPMLGLGQASWLELRSIFKPAAGHVGIALGQVITLQGGIQILNQIAPPSLVVLYSMSRTLMRLVLQVGVIGNHSLRPVLSRLFGENKERQAILFTYKITGIFLIAAIFVYAILVILGPWIMQFWSNGRVFVNHAELALIGAHALFGVVWSVPVAYKMAKNKHSSLSLVYFFASILSVGGWLLIHENSSPLFVSAISLAIPEMAGCFFVVFGILAEKKSGVNVFANIR